MKHHMTVIVVIYRGAHTRIVYGPVRGIYRVCGLVEPDITVTESAEVKLLIRRKFHFRFCKNSAKNSARRSPSPKPLVAQRRRGAFES